MPRPEPRNKLSPAERAAVLEACNSAEFASLPPSRIVPKLADQERYLASESSFYRILRAEGQQHHRGRARPPVRRNPPASYKASAPCDVRTWDITWMPGPVAGMFFHLYLIVDIFSRKIVGWEVHERESAELAAAPIRQAVQAEGCITRPRVLHADNGSPMKGATMKVTMEKLGITASSSRPRVSNDNPFCEALFRTCKYRPDWPTKGFASKADAQVWVKSFARWYNGEHLHSAIRLGTAALRSGEYPKSSSSPARLKSRGKVEQRTTSLTQGESLPPLRTWTFHFPEGSLRIVAMTTCLHSWILHRKALFSDTYMAGAKVRVVSSNLIARSNITPLTGCRLPSRNNILAQNDTGLREFIV